MSIAAATGDPTVPGEGLLGLLPLVRDIRRIGSAALDLCAVASGRLDGYHEVGLNPWDLAAGWLMVTEAGGVATGPGGRGPRSALTVAGSAAVRERLLQIVDHQGASA